MTSLSDKCEHCIYQCTRDNYYDSTSECEKYCKENHCIYNATHKNNNKKFLGFPSKSLFIITVSIGFIIFVGIIVAIIFFVHEYLLRRRYNSRSRSVSKHL